MHIDNKKGGKFNMGNAKKNSRSSQKNETSTQDWKSKLNSIKLDMLENMSEQEKKAYQRKQQNIVINQKKLNALKPELYAFLAGYKQNSGIFVNNFFRKRGFKLYEEDKFHSFDFDISGIIPNIFDDPVFSMYMVDYLRKLEEFGIAYFPITAGFIRKLKVFSDALDYAPRIECSTTLYRGCSTIERNGVNGIVSTTTNYEIAKQFSRGTLLEIHVPEGTKCLNVKSIRQKDQRRKDKENEILLPPCNYEIISKKVVKKHHEPNNIHNNTTILEINVKPLDLLTEFLKVMENPVQEYIDKVMYEQKDNYEEALMLLKDFIGHSEEL